MEETPVVQPHQVGYQVRLILQGVPPPAGPQMVGWKKKQAIFELNASILRKL